MPKRHDYVTVDVFTDRAFAGNPLAVVTAATGLHPEQMQAIAAESRLASSAILGAVWVASSGGNTKVDSTVM